MKRFKILVMVMVMLGGKCFSQTNEEILKDLKDVDEGSYFRAGVGIGNKIFSTQNNSLNAQQTNKSLVFTPSIGYFHKSGLSLTATGYLLSSGGNSGFLQYAINPAYDYTKSEDFTTSLSYTHYFVTSAYNTSLTPIQNDFFGSITAKKGWLKPGVEVGYATGNFKNITHVDTVVRTGLVSNHYNFTDTSTTRLNSFSFSGTLEHTFTSSNVFSEKDAFSFLPQLMLNFGSSTETVIQTTSGTRSLLVNRRKITKRKLKNSSSSGNYNSPFTLQSLGLNLEGDYSIGKFDIQPDVYFDYYIPASTAKKLTKLFSITFSYSF